MGLGGVAIATLPSVICAKLMFSDGLGGRYLVKSVSPNLFCLKEFCQTATNYYLMGAF